MAAPRLPFGSFGVTEGLLLFGLVCVTGGLLDVRPSFGVVYGKGLTNCTNGTDCLSSRELTLDLYEPVGGNGALRPALVVIHGGSYCILNSNETGEVAQAEYFARRGFVAASINYRLSGDRGNYPAGYDAFVPLFNASSWYGNNFNHMYPAVRDAKAAIRWMRSRADALGVDPGRIAVSGSSAGATSVMVRRGGVRAPQTSSSTTRPLAGRRRRRRIRFQGRRARGRSHARVHAPGRVLRRPGGGLAVGRGLRRRGPRMGRRYSAHHRRVSADPRPGRHERHRHRARELRVALREVRRRRRDVRARPTARRRPRRVERNARRRGGVAKSPRLRLPLLPPAPPGLGKSLAYTPNLACVRFLFFTNGSVRTPVRRRGHDANGTRRRSSWDSRTKQTRAHQGRLRVYECNR